MRVLSRTLLWLSLVSLGCSAAPPPAAVTRSEPPVTPAPSAGVDYLAIAPRALLVAFEPLLSHRAAHGHVVERLAIEDLLAHKPAGTSDAEAVAAGIAAVAAWPSARLRFVLLGGDAPGPEEAPGDFVPVPTFYLEKVDYENHRPIEDYHVERRAWDTYASDLPYARAIRGAPPLAVGRVPARTPEEARGFAAKVVVYETGRPEGLWRRRIEVLGGPANFGMVADQLIESTATRLLDTEVPYDFDVRVIFPKVDSAYAVPFRDLRQRIADDLGEGALIAAYVGHGASTSFEDVEFHDHYFEIGTAEDAAGLRIGDGKPFFISIACNTGAYDLPYGQRSLGEVMTLNTRGPIAVFAASRESHPYPNALYGQALLQAFIKKRAATLGEGILEAKRQMLESEMPIATLLFDADVGALKAEHEGIYNLLGDPATVLRYPAEARVSLEAPKGAVTPGAELAVTLDAPAIPAGTATLTVETFRSVIRGKLVSPRELLEMADEDVWRAMRKNYETASNKVVSRVEQPIAGGRATLRVIAPSAAGEYELKVFAAGGGEAAAGHLRVHVSAN